MNAILDPPEKSVEDIYKAFNVPCPFTREESLPQVEKPVTLVNKRMTLTSITPQMIHKEVQYLHALKKEAVSSATQIDINCDRISSLMFLQYVAPDIMTFDPKDKFEVILPTKIKTQLREKRPDLLDAIYGVVPKQKKRTDPTELDDGEFGNTEAEQFKWVKMHRDAKRCLAYKTLTKSARLMYWDAWEKWVNDSQNYPISIANKGMEYSFRNCDEMIAISTFKKARTELIDHGFFKTHHTWKPKYRTPMRITKSDKWRTYTPTENEMKRLVNYDDTKKKELTKSNDRLKTLQGND